MRANEMFWILLHDCREMSAYIDQEINNNGSNGNIELLKEYLDKTKMNDEGGLSLPIPFNDAPADDKLKIGVYVSEYLYCILMIASNLFKERRNTVVGNIFGVASRMHGNFKKWIFEID